MALPALPTTADTRTLAERTNVLIRDFNGRRTAVPTAELPASPAVGERWIVTNASSATFNAVLTGGGVNIVPVFWNGSQWRVG
jgi:hypothetical protein